MDAKRIIDISKVIARETAVWPGDTAFQIQSTMSIAQGDVVNLSTLTLSAHTATHADAPSHVVDERETIDLVDLHIYWGHAQVVTVAIAQGPLMPHHFENFDLSLAPRLLVRTPSGEVPYNQFPDKIPYPSPLLADFLAANDIILYGTDAPSMDALDSHTLPGHKAMINNRIAILEGLDLTGAEDGIYELSALPLKIRGGDGSPLRAALRRLG